MKINMQARSFSLSKALRAHVQRRLSFALQKKADQIQHIMVRLSDINGPKGGIDKRCQIQIVLPHLNDVVVEDKESDIYVAIDRAANRAARVVRRRLSRRRQLNRSMRPGESQLFSPA